MHKTSQRGFSLVELVIVFVVLAIIGGAAAASCGIGAPARSSNATGYARDWARRFKGWSSPVIDCMGNDTDNNGYVTCTIGDGRGQVEQIECAANTVIEINVGCRPYARMIGVGGPAPVYAPAQPATP